jgi:hypothetical protein
MICTIYGFKNLYTLVELQHAETPNIGWPKFSEYWMALVSCCGFLLLRKIIVAFVYNSFYQRYSDTKNDENLRVEKAMKTSINFFKAVCYAALCFVGYFVFLKDEYFLDTRMFGKGDLYRVYDGYPI